MNKHRRSFFPGLKAQAASVVLDKQLLHAGVLGFQLLQSLEVRHAHTAELAAPELVAGLGETVLSTQLLEWQPGLGFAQEANDLLFGEALLHVQPSQVGIGLQSAVQLKYGVTSTDGALCIAVEKMSQGPVDKRLSGDVMKRWVTLNG